MKIYFFFLKFNCRCKACVVNFKLIFHATSFVVLVRQGHISLFLKKTHNNFTESITPATIIEDKNGD